MRSQNIVTQIILGFILLGHLSCKSELDEIVTVTTSDYVVAIDENPPAGTKLGTVEGATNAGKVSFEVTTQSPEGAFIIDPSTGVLSVANHLLYDFELHPILTGVVRVSNGDVFKNAAVTINLNNLGKIEVPTTEHSITLDENPVEGLSIGVIEASTNDGKVSFEIITQSPAGAFNIGPATGEITVANPLLFDYEANPTITGIIKVTNGEVSAQVALTIHLTDLFEIEVTTSDFLLTIDENPPAGIALGSVEGTTNNGEVTFEITAQTPEGAFTIDPSTGVLTVANHLHFDFEVNPTITGVVKVSNGEVYANSNITISLNDIDNCVEAKQLSESLFTHLLENNFNMEVTMDLVTHSYTFQVKKSGQLCSIGYQGIIDAPYLIEIVDANGNILYSGHLTFSKAQQEYKSITPIQLLANQDYTVKRTVVNYNSYDDILGNILISPDPNNFEFPVSFGDLTIIKSFDNMPSYYTWIPYITFGFTED